MDILLTTVFGPYLKRGLRLSDGRKTSTGSHGWQLAASLIRKDPVRYAESIVELMKPFCRRFDVRSVQVQVSLIHSSPEFQKAVSANGKENVLHEVTSARHSSDVA